MSSLEVIHHFSGIAVHSALPFQILILVSKYIITYFYPSINDISNKLQDHRDGEKSS